MSKIKWWQLNRIWKWFKDLLTYDKAMQEAWRRGTEKGKVDK